MPELVKRLRELAGKHPRYGYRRITALLRALTDGEEKPLLGDRRFRWLALAALPVYLLAMYWGPPARFFRLAALSLSEWGLVLAVVVPAFLLCKLTDWWVARPRE